MMVVVWWLVDSGGGRGSAAVLGALITALDRLLCVYIIGLA
jgi:hypothetical protein